MTAITGITLEGFQVFDKPTHIPLADLTLMYGPNSAGKSAIADALKLFVALLVRYECQEYEAKTDWNLLLGGEPDSSVRPLLERHWRRVSGAKNSRVEKLSVSVEHSTSCGVDSATASHLRRDLLDDPNFTCPETLQLVSAWTFHRFEGDSEAELRFTTDFEFWIESELVVSRTGEDFCINVAHPIIRSIPLKFDLDAVARTYPEHASFADGKFMLHEVLNACQLGIARWGRKKESGDYSLLHTAISEIGLVAGAILSKAQSNTDFTLNTVDASRTVPTQQELTYPIYYAEDALVQEQSGGAGAYKKLAESLAVPLFAHQEPPPVAESARFAENVNRALANHLFLDHGYRVDYDFRVLLTASNSQAAFDGEELDRREFNYLVVLFLRDANGRKLQVEDVGSGIGYVLPVLCAVFEPSHVTTFIQQPELHLHPALQAALGDVFIEAVKAGKQLVIESHSEHLLLRVLKRIRQTHLKATIAPELQTTAEQVCVLYFDPAPDGTTAVKRLRITEDGEFMDRWPRGFFAERDQELLDE